MKNNKATDIFGIGKSLNAIPKESWIMLTELACTTIEKFLAPITETTYGVGELIKTKFANINEMEKISFAEIVRKVQEKVDKTNRKPKYKVKSKLFIEAMKNVAVESDKMLRELWANLICNEVIDGNIHPEFPEIIKKLDSEEAILLINIAKNSKEKIVLTSLIQIVNAFSFSVLTFPNSSFRHEHLKLLGLIDRYGGVWELTMFGHAFLNAVSEEGLK